MNLALNIENKVAESVSPHSPKRKRTGGTPEHQKTQIWTLGWMLCSRWTPGGPRSGRHLNIPDNKKKLSQTGPVVTDRGVIMNAELYLLLTEA